MRRRSTLGIVMSALSTLVSLDIGKAVFLFAAFTSIVNFTTLMFWIRWGALRRYGLPYYAFQLVIAVAATAIILQASSAVVLLLTDINVDWAVNLLIALIVLVAALYIYLDRKDKKSFSLERLIFRFAMPLSPIGAYYALASIGKGGWLLHLMPRLFGPF